MATFKSNKAATGAPIRIRFGAVTHEYAEYTGTATLAAGDIIQMVKVPRGARLVDLVVSVGVQAAASTGSAVIANVGDGVDVDRYLAQVSASSLVALQRVFPNGAGAATTVNGTALGYEYTADDTIDIQIEDLGASAVHTSAPVFKMLASYIVDNAENL